MALRKHWYSQDIVMFNIIEQLKFKETVFIAKNKGVIRCVKANAMRYLAMNFDRYHFLEHKMNLYGSLAHFPNLPMFSFNRTEKRKEMDAFNLSYKDYISGFNYMMDIDNFDLKSAHRTLLACLKAFQGIPYYVVMTGKKGFHIRVDYEDMSEDLKQMSMPDLCGLFKRFTENFSLINNLPDIDYSIYDLRRIAKTPYSVVFYPLKDKDGNVEEFPLFVALPMTDDQIYKFDIKDYHIKTQLNNLPDLRNRGLLKREGSPEKFSELIKKYGDIR